MTPNRKEKRKRLNQITFGIFTVCLLMAWPMTYVLIKNGYFAFYIPASASPERPVGTYEFAIVTGALTIYWFFIVFKHFKNKKSENENDQN